MPTEYKSKGTVKTGQWSEESLREAIRRLRSKEILFREAERYYDIPA